MSVLNNDLLPVSALVSHHLVKSAKYTAMILRGRSRTAVEDRSLALLARPSDLDKSQSKSGRMVVLSTNSRFRTLLQHGHSTLHSCLQPVRGGSDFYREMLTRQSGILDVGFVTNI